ncbi:efflux RND transporter permease subunit [Thermodesulfobacteriota bacterium]
MAGYGISILEVQHALQGTDASVTAGSFNRRNMEVTVTSDSFVASAREVKTLVVGVHGGRPVYLRDIAEVHDAPEEAQNYSRIGFSHHYLQEQKTSPDAVFSFPAVTLAIAKKKGKNAVLVAKNLLQRLKELEGNVIPDDVQVQVTRNYGQTAQRKVSDLIKSLLFAILTVVGLLALTLGWREALVVAVAVPISFSLALFVNYLFGYTINRVTLFALILSHGLSSPYTLHRHPGAAARRRGVRWP